MKEFVEKLIGRLEEYPHGKYEDEYGKGFSNGINVAITEVNELAEEYKDNDYWKIIYNKVCELEKKYANDGNTESVNDCIKLENLLQYFKEELQGKEEYINTSTDTSSGWIPVSGKLPNDMEQCLVTLENGYVMFATYIIDEFMSPIGHFVEGNKPIAWMPLPAPYKE